MDAPPMAPTIETIIIASDVSELSTHALNDCQWRDSMVARALRARVVIPRIWTVVEVALRER